MKAAALALSVALNVALVVVLCSFSMSNSRGHLSAGLAARTTGAARSIIPMNTVSRNRNLAVYANKQVVEPREKPVPAGKIRLRLGAPATAAAAAAGVCALNTLPAMAAGGALFDFDLTLPYMATELLVLSFFLDKLWFGPLGTILEKRQGILKGNMESVAANLEECDQIIDFVETTLVDVTKGFAKESNDKIQSLNAECEAAMAATKARVEEETKKALDGMDRDQQIVLSDMDNEIEKFCWEIVGKVVDEKTFKSWKDADAATFTGSRYAEAEEMIAA